jgi:hypothetical protein
MKRWIVFGILIFMAGCIKNPFSPSDSDSKKTQEVEYRVSGTAGRVTVTYRNPSGGTEQIGSQTLPWSVTFSCEAAQFLYVSAQNISGESGTVTTQIVRGGKQYKSSTSTGVGVMATAEGECNGN